MVNYGKQKRPRTLSYSGLAGYLKVKTTPYEGIPSAGASVSENLYSKLTKGKA